MTDTTQTSPIAGWLQGREQFPAPLTDSLVALRARALERANALSVPTTRDEEWRFTDLAPLGKMSFRPVARAADFDATLLDGLLVPEAAARLVYCDGHLVPSLSDISSVPEGLHIVAGDPDLGSIAHFDQDLFVALNTSFLHAPLVLQTDADADCALPVHLIFVTTTPDSIAYPRVFIRARRGSRVCVVEEYVGATQSAALVDAVTEIDVEAEAVVTHIRLQRQPDTQFHVGHMSARLGRAATLHSHCVTTGSRLSRQNLAILQAGEGVHCTVNGLALLRGRQHADTHSSMDHGKPHGQSEQVHKCIVDGTARAVFNGKILVREGAQLTNATQHSRNLLLSDRARVDTKPQLEIYADDVKCAHGATVGQLEAEELFYLRSRGLSEQNARSLLTYAFAAEVIERIPVASLVRRLQKELMSHTTLEHKS